MVITESSDVKGCLRGYSELDLHPVSDRLRLHDRYDGGRRRESNISYLITAIVGVERRVTVGSLIDGNIFGKMFHGKLPYRFVLAGIERLQPAGELFTGRGIGYRNLSPARDAPFLPDQAKQNNHRQHDSAQD